jgi:hypothetical protein
MNATSLGARSALLIAVLFFGAVCALADDEQSTEIQGYYQTYRNFSFKTGASDFDIPSTALNGGGFAVAQNVAPWFAMWTQLTIYGTANSPNNTVRIIHNLEGVRWQTKKHGPLQLYAKFGMGFAHYGMNVGGNSIGDTKFSLGYGGGAVIWASEHCGLVLDASHSLMSLPNLTDLSGRDKWDSGLAFSTGIAVRF